MLRDMQVATGAGRVIVLWQQGGDVVCVYGLVQKYSNVKFVDVQEL